ncbi:MAG: polysaccharide deacetylase family protein [Phycisphaeraceae bacterium]
MKNTAVLGIDMETDIGSWTPFYEGLVHGTPRLLSCMADHQVAGTFFFTGDAAQAHRGVVKDVAAAGHEVGCHSLHHETVGKSLFPIPGIYPLLPHEVRPRIDLATRVIEDVVGSKVQSFRCPRLFGDTNVTNALEELGYLADASYPMYFYEDRHLPYHPSKDDWTREGDLKLVEIPVFADMSIDSKDEHGRDRDQWPLFRTRSTAALMEHVRGFLGFMEARSDQACLCFYFHPWEFWPMPQGAIHYGEGSVTPDPFLVENCGDYALEQFHLLLTELKEMGVEFLSAGDLARRHSA